MAEVQTTVKDVVTSLVEKYEKPLDPIEFALKLKEVCGLLTNKYYLLICPDLRQYVFIDIQHNEIENIYDVMYDILVARGQVVMIDRDNEDKGIWEFYIKDKFDGKLYFYQFRDYTNDTVVI